MFLHAVLTTLIFFVLWFKKKGGFGLMYRLCRLWSLSLSTFLLLAPHSSSSASIFDKLSSSLHVFAVYSREGIVCSLMQSTHRLRVRLSIAHTPP